MGTDQTGCRPATQNNTYLLRGKGSLNVAKYILKTTDFKKKKKAETV